MAVKQRNGWGSGTKRRFKIVFGRSQLANNNMRLFSLLFPQIGRMFEGLVNC